MSEFGDHIKNLRKIRKLSLRELSEKSGVSHTQISRIELGQRENPKPETIQKLAEGLEVDMIELMSVAGYGYIEIPQLFLDEDTRRVIEEFNKLHPQSKKVVEDLIQSLLNNKGDQ